ncbi:metallophosphoesterase [Paenibacillus alkaliterrae]|uniref:metallophosphoesterase family protein n=1 Tax=Paenibacillus alkaliterrae TaxID=320909 RepID=UPI001F1EFA73|nr:metallophosphoesterase [Paenibacillus alkaliterrae]MCF2938127.1 metallophosphoesterase [Paenibacillus alkaliterrae]
MEHSYKAPAEQPVIRFQVITDTHVTTDPEHVYNFHFGQALRDIKATAPDSIGIMHVGDLTDSGADAEYAEVRRIWNENKAGLPDLLTTSGNHDVSTGDWRARIENFLGQTGMSGAYHDHWINGYHFIFLGTEDGTNGFADLSETQLAWLDAKLAEEAASGKPKFVFLHQPLMNTVAGSSETQGWYGVNQDKETKAILARHPQTILFTGHTHWVFGSPNTIHGGNGTATMFNASSVAYLWTDEDVEKAGSEGFFVEVYEDRVLVRGRDFITGTWVEEAQFTVPNALVL